MTSALSDHLSPPSRIVKSPAVRSASLLQVDVRQANSPTSRGARLERQKAQSRKTSAPYPPTSIDMRQGHKTPSNGLSSTIAPSTSAQPLVILLTECKSMTIPEYVPAFSSATSAATRSSSGQHQVIVLSGTPEPGQESPRIVTSVSRESSPNHGKSQNVIRVLQLDKKDQNKVLTACGFCRFHRIGCRCGPAWENDDQLPPGPRTCDNCFSRCLECFYPTTYHRGSRKGVPTRKIVYGESSKSVSFVNCQEGAALEGSSGGDTFIAKEQDGTTKKGGKGSSNKNWKDFTCHMFRAVDADWVLDRRQIES
ncbi:hypothetical protein FRC03_011689 [Tulasnella sp. 419]|nr:hypothetical protein FRC03_011689 [Tulasnella sp. 419]